MHAKGFLTIASWTIYQWTSIHKSLGNSALNKTAFVLVTFGMAFIMTNNVYLITAASAGLRKSCEL